MTDDQQKKVAWSQARPLVQLVTSVRMDELDLPMVEEDYGNRDSLFGWELGKDSGEAVNLWTKSFQEWYEETTGGTLIDHEIAPAYCSMSDEAARIYEHCKGKGNCGTNEKERILYAIRKLELVSQMIKSQYDNSASNLTGRISSASAEKEAECKDEYHARIDSLTRKIMRDLNEYNEIYREKTVKV